MLLGKKKASELGEDVCVCHNTYRRNCALRQVNTNASLLRKIPQIILRQNYEKGSLKLKCGMGIIVNVQCKSD